MSTPLFTRRSMLLGGAGLLGLGALTACGGASDAGDTGSGGNGARATLPNHVAFAGPTPDLPGNEMGVNPGFTSYPSIDDLVTMIDSPPGDGQPVSVMAKYWSAARPAMAENSFWQNLNELLGSQMDIEMVPGTDYPTKFATTVAGGEMPDIFTVEPTRELPRLLASSAVDLTDHLSGDAISAYPYLANNPQAAWPYTLYGGRIYTLPVFRGLLSSTICFQRTDLLEEKGMDEAPTSFEDFFAWASELNDPAGGRWAFANFPYEFLRQSLGLPNEWQEEGGVFTSAWEKDEQEEFLSAGRTIVEAGLVHPEGFTGEGWKDRFYNGQAYLCRDSIAAWTQFYSQFDTANPGGAVEDFRIDGVSMFDYDSGVTGAPWRGPDVSVTCAIGKQAEDRVEAILGILNYLAAPIGSTERISGRLGVEGVHYTIVDGTPTSTDLGKSESFALTDLIAAPYEIITRYADAVEGLYGFESEIAPTAVANPADALYSETRLSAGASLTTLIDDATNEILQGRQPVSDWSGVVSDYMANGGSDIKAELEDAFAAANA